MLEMKLRFRYPVGFAEDCGPVSGRMSVVLDMICTNSKKTENYNANINIKDQRLDPNCVCCCVTHRSIGVWLNVAGSNKHIVALAKHVICRNGEKVLQWEKFGNWQCWHLYLVFSCLHLAPLQQLILDSGCTTVQWRVSKLKQSTRCWWSCRCSGRAARGVRGRADDGCW